MDAATLVDAELAEPARWLAEAYDAARPEDLLIDYTRLFLGPVKARAELYGSAWLEVDGGLMQGSTVAVTALYAEGGFEIAEEFRDLPDHVAAELEFLYLLLFKLAQARMSGDSEAANTANALRRQFLDRHLGAWVGPFAGAVRAGAQTDFYRALGALTEGFVGLEARA